MFYSGTASAVPFFGNFTLPPFSGIHAWLNSSPLDKKALEGKVVLIDFWTYSCINCIRTLPYLKAWHQRYAKHGLVIVGVHAPEFEFEKSKRNVIAALKRYNITYPVALDNDMSTWNTYSNRYWPAKYLFNRKHKLVEYHFGEGAYDETEARIREALGLPPKKIKKSTKRYNQKQTHETYLGYWRVDKHAPGTLGAGAKVFTPAKKLKNDYWDLSGAWQVYYKKIVARQDNATLRLNFSSKEVFLVIGGPKGATVTVSDAQGKKRRINTRDVKNGVLTVDQHRLYHILSLDSFRQGLLTLHASKGTELYAFTFGS